MSSRPKRRRPARQGAPGNGSRGRSGATGHGSGESGRNARLRAEAAARGARQRARRRWVVAGVVAIALVVVAGGILLGRQSDQAGGSSDTPLNVVDTVPADARAPQSLSAGEPVVFGPAGAAHALTIWADFSCPHCADFATEYRETLTRARDAGQVSVGVMPVTFVAPPSSTRAGNAFACATEAGFGEAYHDALFASFSTDWDEAGLLALAERVAPQPGEAFTRCVSDSGQQAYLDSVDAAAGVAGVESTPTVMLDGTVLDLSQTTPATLAELLQENA